MLRNVTILLPTVSKIRSARNVFLAWDMAGKAQHERYSGQRMSYQQAWPCWLSERPSSWKPREL